jgi:hypothetical protein
MRIQHISAGLAFVIALACLPQHARAYFTTGQTAVKLSDTSALYMIEYSFGLKDHDIYMPIAAERNPKNNDAQSVGYTLQEDGHTVTQGATSGIVASNAPVVNGMYKIARGTAEKMTLFVILATQSDTPHKYYALSVNRLPYYVDRGNPQLQELQLNPSELQYYATEEIELNAE